MAHVRTLRVIPDSHMAVHCVLFTHFLNSLPAIPFLLAFTHGTPLHSCHSLPAYTPVPVSLRIHLHTVPLKRSFYHPKDTSYLVTPLCLCTSYSCLEYVHTCNWQVPTYLARRCLSTFSNVTFLWVLTPSRTSHSLLSFIFSTYES